MTLFCCKQPLLILTILGVFVFTSCQEEFSNTLDLDTEIAEISFENEPRKVFMLPIAEAENIFSQKKLGKNHSLTEGLPYGFFIESPEKDSHNIEVAAIPFISDNIFRGIVTYVGEHDSYYYYSFLDLLDFMIKNQPECGRPVNTVVLFTFLIQFYQFEEVERRLSEYLEGLEALNCLNKNLSVEIAGQYIDYVDGTPDAVVGYEHEVIIPCGTDSGGGGRIDFGELLPDADPIEPGGGGEVIYPGEEGEEETAELITQALRAWMVENCGYSYDQIPILNLGAGLAFENAVLDALNIPKNTTRFPSPVRATETNGNKNLVEPDGVSSTIHSPNGNVTNIQTYPNTVFHEVKAYTGTVYLSSDSYQIKGEIDALANNSTNLPSGVKPAFYIYTTSTGSIHVDVSNYATQRNVRLFHVTASVNTQGVVRISSTTKKNFTSQPHIPTAIGALASLKCPESAPSNRLDPETLRD